jgi:flavin reductase (DIM6/NTAB) family NADH-FMN oxidoreductase RutF
MKGFGRLGKVFNLLKKTKRLKSAVKLVCKEIENRITALPELPQGKIAIPLAVKPNVFPIPVVVCGALVEGRPNFNTIVNFGVISPARPSPVVYISSSKEHYTNIGIRKNGVFSVNVASRAIMAQTDYLGVVSGHNIDKSKVLTVFYGRHDNAPCLAECPLNYVCKVTHHVEINTMDVFIAEIAEAFVSSEFLRNNTIDIESMEMLIYTADNNYRIPSAPVSRAYSVFKEYKPIK